MSEISLVNSNGFKSTPESKIETLKKLSKTEQDLFIKFAFSVESRSTFIFPVGIIKD
ncbi:TPA: hypothetical protein NNW70_004292 [Salmonella enterica]|nr:hypothetical protein [Salmonella enterica]HCH9608002.1 hypothetical protein [Salmonella enterica]HDI5000296.1 hypothetical protein [Salmonella enterica]